MATNSEPEEATLQPTEAVRPSRSSWYYELLRQDQETTDDQRQADADLAARFER